MNTGKIITNSLTIIQAEGGKQVLHFGFFKIDGEESYYCYERLYVVKPTLELANKHIAEINEQYCITDNEWEANVGRVQNVQ